MLCQTLSNAPVDYPCGVSVQFPADPEPNRLEKLNQLSRLLATKPFRKSPKLSELLTYLVESDLAGTTATQHLTGVRVFGRSEDWYPTDDNTVREAMRRLRNLLTNYYAFGGLEDRVDLEFDEYKPVFSYNARHPLERELRRGLRHIATDSKLAFSHFDAVLSIDPRHAEALAGRAEAELWRPVTGNEVGLAGILEAAEIQARQALELDEKCWRAHVVNGALRVCRCEWTKAGEHFDRALAASSDQTRAHPWYSTFLMAVGRTDEALALTKAKASEPSDMPWPQLTYAAFLYAARRFDEAREEIRIARQDYEDVWLSHVLWSCILSGMGRDKSTVPFLGMSMPQQLPDSTPVYTGLCLLETMKRLDPGHADYARARKASEKWLRKKMTVWRSAPSEKSFSPFAEIRVSPFHMALACMALGEQEKAIELLGEDMERGHPIMAWLHLWPVFDSLRQDARFQDLIRRMKLPSQGSASVATKR